MNAVSVARDITTCAPLCLASKSEEVETDLKHEPCKLVTWGVMANKQDKRSLNIKVVITVRTNRTRCL